MASWGAAFDRRWILALGVVAGLSGCVPRSPGPDDLVGTWKTDSGAELIVRRNGEFSAKSIPGEYFGFEYHGLATGPGRWRLVTAPGQTQFLDLFWELRFHFGPNSVLGPGLDAQIYYVEAAFGSPATLQFWPDGEATGMVEDFTRR